MKKILVSSMLLALTACATVPAPRYFSLQPTWQQVISTVNNDSDAKAVVIRLEKVPAQVNRRQIVLNLTGDEGVQLLNDYQWSTALADELSAALNANVSDGLNMASASLLQSTDKLPYWRVTVDVLRFESVFEEQVRQTYAWRVTPVGFSGTAQLCRATLVADAGKGVEGLVEGHQQAVTQLSSLLAQQLAHNSAQAPQLPQAQTVVREFQCSAIPAATAS